jgi:hypothetical protein
MFPVMIYVKRGRKRQDLILTNSESSHQCWFSAVCSFKMLISKSPHNPEDQHIRHLHHHFRT